MNPNTNVSLLLTSCDRHDLLKATLESFYEVTDLVPQQIAIYEDSAAPKPEWLNEEKWRFRHVEWISDGERKGQTYAICRLIKEARHDYTLWMEEDWLFQKHNGPFIKESKAILDAHPHILQVSLRGNTGWHPLVRQGDLWIAEAYWRGVWGGLSWNPGLRRTKELRDVVMPLVVQNLGAGGLKHEEACSKALLDMGYRIADLNKAIVTHTGGGRSRAVEKVPPLPKILIAVPTCFEFDYESHALVNDEKFHVNGFNEQTKAVRDTWGKDFLKYPNVDVKFFYGRPKAGYPRQALPDEVFLECGDGYDSLIDKTIGVCRYAVENGYKYVAKFDTDTFVYPDRLLLELMENGGNYMGYLHADVCSGGPGYILSQRAAQIVATQGGSHRHPYAEDVTVSWTLAANGIRPTMLQHHRPGFSAHFFFQKPEVFDPTLIPEQIVTAHAVFPSAMRKWWDYVEKQRQRAAEEKQ